jgi:hypothetical protein
VNVRGHRTSCTARLALGAAAQTVDVAIETGTDQITVDPGVTISALARLAVPSRWHKASSYPVSWFRHLC